MDRKTKIGAVLTVLGVTAATIGGVTLNNGVVTAPKIPIPKCIGEELIIEKETVCMDKGSYNSIKAIFKTKGMNDNPVYLWTDIGRLHLAIINHEISKQDVKLYPKNASDAVEIFQLGNKLL